MVESGWNPCFAPECLLPSGIGHGVEDSAKSSLAIKNQIGKTAVQYR